MLIVRCTAKLLDRLKVQLLPSRVPSSTVLGDWYATILPLRPAHLVLLVDETTRLPVVLPARELSTLARRIPEAIAEVLRDLGVDPEAIDRERQAMAEMAFDKTASRSVLGTMNEHAFHLGLTREKQPTLTEHALSMDLGRMLVTVPGHGYQHPGEFAARLLGNAQPGSRALATPFGRSISMKSPASIYELKVTLRDTRPPVWRRIRVRSDVTLFKLHSILQYVMGWMDGHMHQFVVGAKTYGGVDHEFPECENEKKVMLSQVLRKPKDSLVYEYDFGDGWEHSVVLEQRLEAESGGKYPYVVEGKGACPPEDCGGTGGYEHLLKVLANPRHPEHADMVEWVGGSFDPEAFEAGEINRGFHGGWYLPPSHDGSRSKTALPRQTRRKRTTPRRRG
jgi:hypothetical protein